MSLSHSAGPPGSRPWWARDIKLIMSQQSHQTVPLSVLTHVSGPWLPAWTPSVNPGLVPRGLSGTQVLYEDMGTGLGGGY